MFLELSNGRSYGRSDDGRQSQPRITKADSSMDDESGFNVESLVHRALKKTRDSPLPTTRKSVATPTLASSTG